MEKRSSRIVLIVLLLTVYQSSFAQDIEDIKTIEIRLAHTFTPGNYIGIRYERFKNININYSAKVFYEQSTVNNLNYSSYDLDIMAEYYALVGQRTNHKWELKGGLGLTGLVASEPWILKDWAFNRKLNYGIVGEMAAEWGMTEEFSLTAYVQQKVLFNKELGNAKFLLGLGFKFKILQ